MKKESDFQKKVMEEIKQRLPGCYVYKNESYIQGFPDVTVLYNDRWATLECKREKDADHQPNQEFYVDDMNRKSFSAIIYPENKEEVLNEMEQSLKVRRSARIPQSERLSLDQLRQK